MLETREGIETRHKKELKELDGEQRAALKKAKTTAGKSKKAKDAIAQTQAEYEIKLKEVQDRHLRELDVASDDTLPSTQAFAVTNDDGATADDAPVNSVSPEEEERQRKIEKTRRKKEKQREKDIFRERQVQVETAQAGPSPRDVENTQILEQLTPLHLTLHEVVADGHCLYRAVGAQIGSSDYLELRNLCSDTLLAHEADFAPFCEYDETAPDFGSYVNRVRTTATWGGHLELRALSIGLGRPIWVYSAQAREPLIIEHDSDNGEPIRLSYHLRFYALGEHYNQVVPVTN